MDNKNINQLNNLSLFCWNISNPSIERAGKQAEWLRKRSESVLILTEAKHSKGCVFLERYFQSFGYNVVFPKPEGKEFGVIIISKHSILPSSFSMRVDYLQARAVSVELNFPIGKIEIIGAYIPSRNASYEKIERKKRFLKSLIKALEKSSKTAMRIFCGDFNVLEPNHIPRYPFFEDWEYDFYRDLSKYQLKDVFRHFYPSLQEYSWVGRTGDGYRYDHCFTSINLLPSVKKCYYFHETRKMKLSDHSAIICELEVQNLMNSKTENE